ncbi:serine/threonine protein kinase [Streptomyces sp. NBC_01795]|uniref:serine/threonine-protein kinase n=1 Tax=Streptomyces sp. NBC_01795 TaxID=2975943 RepID=UPI002DD79F82|nr:serine/threonine-protein kinase [Streptomyces sp. NBC_01795]WSA93077.1 serine/threonine protein kinase [Streptomyces sp. NBC_01795]
MRPLEPGDPRELGEYRLLRRLGAGGMGRVYLARSMSGRTVAVKVVHPHIAMDEQFRARFRREVDSARRVGGDWTAPVLDADPEAQLPWAATGYVAGPALADAVQEYGPLPETSVRAVGAGLAEALRHVHGLGLVHRDVKPSNVLLTVDGPRLIDFGIARATDGTSSLTSSGVSVGSPGYMSPEQVLGQVAGGPSDVFSLGAVLAYAATGKAPFPGNSSASLLYKVVHEDPDLDGLDGLLREVIARCLAKAEEDRPLPRQLAQELAGPAGGAAGLVRSGWLPGPIVEQVGRRAVELLSLEPEAPAPPSSGPIPFTSLASTGGSVSGSGVAPGSGSDQQFSGQGGPGPGPGAGVGPGPGPGPGAGVGVGFGPAPGYGSGSPEPAKAQLRVGGRRRVSCTLVVTLACVVAAAALSGSYFLGLFPGRNKGNSDTAHPKPPASERGGGQETELPQAFVGKWQGNVAYGNDVPDDRMTIDFQRGGKGDKVATGGTRIAKLDIECTGYWKLRSVKGQKVTMDYYSTGTKTCSEDFKGEVFTLRDNKTLKYQSGIGSETGGKGASGTLRKVG